ncbi:MAG: carbohydrate binding domain-containing protein [Chloroflexi bacterium]|nr:carbohydrate binding domain-containing protein [Chloroflexota bacterium]
MRKVISVLMLLGALMLLGQPTSAAPASVFVNVLPRAGLLAPGTKRVELSVKTATPTQCAFALGDSAPFAQMNGLAQGAGTTLHTTTLTGLDSNPNVVNQVRVRCASNPDQVLTLNYRVRADVNPSFPRTGNLWGWWKWRAKGLEYMSRVDLWLGADSATPGEIQQLRTLNPNVLVFTSMNAVEHAALPDDYYLKDIHGNKIEVWPGSYRLNLTKDYVAEYQAQFAYQTLVDSNWMADGVFFDNVFLSQAWLTRDIYGNPVQIDADENGVPDEAAALDAAWYAGVVHEIETFRQLAPGALMTGHALAIDDPNMAAAFNGISIGFDVPEVLDGRDSFGKVWSKYEKWMTNARAPFLTMFEAAPPYEISYGYDYSPLQKIPKPTLEFARTFYRYMRFGLALTLMRDGYFAYEYGDTWHGNDWWYDEFDFDLGQPLGPATRANIPFDPGPNQIQNPSFEDALGAEWGIWVDTNNGYAATLTRDTATAAAGSASARLDVTAAGPDAWRIELAQRNRSLEKDVTYALTFWAKSDAPRAIGLSTQKQSAPWTNYGLSQDVNLDAAWREYTATFKANATVNDSRVQFFVGASTGTVWLDDVRLTRAAPEVYERDFTNGKVLLNATTLPQTLDVGAGYKRLTGNQAPRVQSIVDNTDARFSTKGKWSKKKYDSGMWKASGPFFHDWENNLYELASATGEARWKLPLEQADTYTISAWIPAAPQAVNWNPRVTYEIVANGKNVASKTIDQTRKGDCWKKIGRAALDPARRPFVRLRCAGKPCVADAIYVQSQARYNDGSAASSVTVPPMDGIILQKE